MARRIEAGPIVVMIGAVLLVVALFLEWFPPAEAWAVFEIVDLLLAALAIAAATAALGLLLPELAVLERRWMAPAGFVALLLVASQLIDPPPTVQDDDLGAGAWLALAAALLMVAGGLLSFSRVRFAVTVEGRDPRRRQAAVVRTPGASGSRQAERRTSTAAGQAPGPPASREDDLATQRMAPPTEPEGAPAPRDG